MAISLDILCLCPGSPFASRFHFNQVDQRTFKNSQAYRHGKVSNDGALELIALHTTVINLSFYDHHKCVSWEAYIRVLAPFRSAGVGKI